MLGLSLSAAAFPVWVGIFTGVGAAATDWPSTTGRGAVSETAAEAPADRIAMASRETNPARRAGRRIEVFMPGPVGGENAWKCAYPGMRGILGRGFTHRPREG